MVIRPVDPGAAARLVQRIEGDRQVCLQVLTERDYHQRQTKTAAPIQVFGLALAGIMSLGAAFFAMNSMYAAVSRRAREIGTLRVLGFSRTAIYVSFLFESVLLAAWGGVLGCALSLPLHGMATGTFNWTAFAEVAFEFRITPALLGTGLIFSVGMGIVGGLLPARLAARRLLLDVLRGACARCYYWPGTG